ncbi:MAG: hypothetical protein IIC84_07880, partial [Chloroflexi bacterium]|nr:hypothetical protein [Chloroflexota bacterium]
TRIDPVLLDELENVGSQNGSEADPKLHALYGAEIISGYQRFEPEGGDF